MPSLPLSRACLLWGCRSLWVTEAWVTKDIANTEILHDDYAIYRKDRQPRTGGDVMMVVKTNSFISSCDEDIETDIEVVSAELVTRSKLKYVICCCYRPPKAGQSWLENFNSFLEEVSSRYINIIICGDFNFPKFETPMAFFICYFIRWWLYIHGTIKWFLPHPSQHLSHTRKQRIRSNYHQPTRSDREHFET